MTAPKGGDLYVLDLLYTDLDQISDLALVGFVHVTNTLAAVLRISAIGVLKLLLSVCKFHIFPLFLIDLLSPINHIIDLLRSFVK
jgi:uncharacterized protein YqhQ